MGIRVIVVADVRLTREWLTEALADSSDLSVAASVENANDLTALVRRGRPDLVIVDRGMPGSIQATRELLAVDPSLKVLAFGVQETEPAVATCLEAGTSGFVPRAATRAQLIEAARRAVRGEFVASPRVADLALRHFAQRAQGNGDGAGGGLSVRERQIARLLELGYSNKEIAARLGIEVATVKNHVHHLFRKLKVRRRGEAVAKWRCCGRMGSARWEVRHSG